MNIKSSWEKLLFSRIWVNWFPSHKGPQFLIKFDLTCLTGNKESAYSQTKYLHKSSKELRLKSNLTYPIYITKQLGPITYDFFSTTNKCNRILNRQSRSLSCHWPERKFWCVRWPFKIPCFYHKVKVYFLNYKVIILRKKLPCLDILFRSIIYFKNF